MTMKKIFALATALGVSTSAASAMDIGFGGEVSLLSDYVASGESQTGRRPALQFEGYAYHSSGFYAGIFLSNVAFSEQWTDYYFGFPIEIDDSIELGLFAGWEYDTDFGLSVDVGYERYFYDDSGDCCGLLYLGARYDVSDMVEVGSRVTWNPDSGNTNIRATMAVYPMDEIGLRAMVGRNQGNFDPDPDDPFSRNDAPSAVTYWNVGVDYFVTDSVRVSLDYHDSNSIVRTSDVVLGLTYAF
ncbi:MAG: hypothetical protein JJU09_08285 [Rhodobacteraceae bacterium]|nr:hypothetical protein [Paracoccaceae bacterium]